MTTPRLVLPALLTGLTLSLAACDQSEPAAAPSESASPAATANSSAGVSTMAMSELARWQVDGFDDQTVTALEAIEGVKVLTADAASGQMLVKWSPTHTSEAAIQQVIADLGQSASPVTAEPEQVAVDIEAPKLHCGACVEGVRGVIAEINGVQLDRISVADHRVTVRVASAEVDGQAVITAMNEAGFVAQPVGDGEAMGKAETAGDSE